MDRLGPRNASITQPICAMPIVQMYVRAAGACAGSCRAARDQRKTIDSRIPTYPLTMTRTSKVDPLSRDANISGSPSASTITPTICTSVATRNTQSSLSYADANHE